MQTLGEHIPQDRYTKLTVKVRLLREIERRLKAEDWSFKTVVWQNVQRHPINDDYDGRDGATLAVVDNFEEFTTDAHKSQAECLVLFEFALKPGAEEEPSDLLNLIQGEIVSLLGGQHTLEEGGTGTGGAKLACGFRPTNFEPEIEEEAEVVRGTLTFALSYRYRNHDPFEPA